MPEVAMVSTILLCEITKITTGTLIMTMVDVYKRQVPHW